MPVDFFDIEHYRKVVAARKAAGLPGRKHAKETAHPLVGGHVVKVRTGEVYNVQSAHLHWYMGWYTVLLIEKNGSHGLLFWENISSISKGILKICATCHQGYMTLEEFSSGTGDSYACND